jgi:hypothetical protein
MARSLGIGAGAVAGLLLVGLVSATRADTPPPRALTCAFAPGTAHAYAQGGFRSEATSALTFDLEDVDLDAQTATLRTPRGTASVRLVRAVNAFHVLEVVREGFLNVTTIYDRDEATGGLPAAHSRHFGILGQPVVSQYFGACRAK